MTPGIDVIDVRRSFGRVAAVRGITLSAYPGRITGLVGPNGAGKTTLLLMLASLLQPDAGHIRIAGADPVTDPAGVRRAVGWMPDALGAWAALSARETLVYTGRLYGMPRSQAQARALALLERVGLDALQNAPARVLSRGQKQRLGLARALVHDPQVLLLDEPASGLDPQARIDLRLLLRSFADAGRTVLVSSHVLAELEEMVDDAVFVVGGQSVAAPAEPRRTRRWRLRVLGEPPTPVTVAGAAGLAPDDVAIDRDAMTLPFASEDDAAAGLARLVHAGIRVVEFVPAVGRLEQTFLDLGGAS
ncbi:ABC transporter ATP-binding protein [Microbacterium sp. SORGH_AS_0888]|uniref:ABC transporter ATP-binding protein n=1 Tax=Microbacterium sp. SORGH_AS_0888 TaxID=3041791 RepID=UPI00277E32F5|nr:ABC transporter ATP-binding protein [Microbacterium sp. SORGH_AS_0888]MDQ1129227.1 ABC-2 type transport system ATP-binding protein [Microbacterium sp. SORGH_AS_0888]